MVRSRALAVAIISAGLLGIPQISPIAPLASAQSQRFAGAREIVDRTQQDLERASTFLQRNHKEVKRLQNAQRHLSDWDRHLTKGKFDKGTLDSVIEDIQNVLDHNTLQAQDRDALIQDIRDLRGIRANRG